jgi:DNA-binding transcriptional ArsR family regulator
MNSISIPEADDEVLVRRLAALAHPVRIRLLRHLGEADACCVKDLVHRIGLAQSTVSQHLKVLLDAGLVTFRPERQSSRYSLDRATLDAVSQAMAAIVSQVCSGGCCQFETKNNDVPARPAADAKSDRTS